MGRYITSRVLAALVTMWGVVTAVFLALRAIPGDPATVVLSGGGTADVDPTAVAALRASLGLDQPLLKQYVNYLGNTAIGRLGESIRDGASVASTIAAPLANTAVLVVLSSIMAALLGIVLGSIAALRSGGLLDRSLSAIIMLGVSAPTYVGAIFLAILFGVTWKWFPPSGYSAITKGVWPYLYYAILPSVALSLTFLSLIGRMTRTSILEVAQQDWVRTARGVGLRQGRVFRRHVLRNALNPVVTVIGLQMGGLLGSTVLVEAIFNWPGIGTRLLRAISERDYPVVQGIVLVLAAVFVVTNIVVDILYGVLDPRVSRK